MKKKYLFFLMFFFANVFVFSQIGINTQNPQKAFHIDPKGNTVTITNSEEIKDDFIVKENGSVGIGTLTPSDFSALEIVSDKGFRLPQLSQDSINALKPLVTGLMLFNTTTKCINIRTETDWIKKCGCTPAKGPLNFSVSPNDRILHEGTNYTFSVSGGSNMDPDFYFWNINGTQGIGPTMEYLIVNDFSSTQVEVTILGCNGSQYVETKEYSHCKPLSGTLALSLPISDELKVDQPYTFRATGATNAVKYDWYINSSSTPSFTTSTNELNYTPPSSGGMSMRVVATDSCGDSIETIKQYSVTNCTPVGGPLSLSPANSSTLTATDPQVFTVEGATNATSYDWYISGSPTSPITTSTNSLSYTPSVTGAISVRVVAKGCNATTVETTNAYTVVAPCTSVAGPVNITPSSGSTLTGGDPVTFSVSGGTNMVGNYTWTFNGNTVKTGSSVVYQIPTGITNLAVSVKITGCNNSSYTQNANYIVNTVNTTAGSFINTTPTGLGNNETLVLKGVSGSKFVWTMYFTDNASTENGATSVVTTTTNTAKFPAYPQANSVRQYTRVVVEVFNSAGIKTHERTYTNVLCPLTGMGSSSRRTIPMGSDCNAYRVCAYPGAGASSNRLTNKWVTRCGNNLQYWNGGSCTAKPAGFTCAYVP